MSDPTIDLMIQHELALKDLYHSCAETWPDQHELWHSLAKEEQDHAKLLRDFKSLIQLGQIRFDAGRFKPRAIENSNDYIREQTERVGTGQLSLRQAMSIATDLEQAMLDNGFFQLLSTDHPRTRSTLERLAGQTINHRQRLEVALAAVKASK